MSASASRDQAGKIHITLTNMDPNAARTVEAFLRGEDFERVSGRILTAETMNAHNTFEQPNAVTPADFDGARVDGDAVTVEMPPKSIIVLEVD